MVRIRMPVNDIELTSIINKLIDGTRYIHQSVNQQAPIYYKRALNTLSTTENEYLLIEKDGEVVDFIAMRCDCGITIFDLRFIDKYLVKEVSSQLMSYGDIAIKIRYECEKELAPGYKEPNDITLNGNNIRINSNPCIVYIHGDEDMISNAFNRRYLTCPKKLDVQFTTLSEVKALEFMNGILSPDEDFLAWEKFSTSNLDDWTEEYIPGFKILGESTKSLRRAFVTVLYTIAHTDNLILGVVCQDCTYGSTLLYGSANIHFVEVASFARNKGIGTKLIQCVVNRDNPKAVTLDPYNRFTPDIATENRVKKMFLNASPKLIMQ